MVVSGEGDHWPSGSDPAWVEGWHCQFEMLFESSAGIQRCGLTPASNVGSFYCRAHVGCAVPRRLSQSLAEGFISVAHNRNIKINPDKPNLPGLPPRIYHREVRNKHKVPEMYRNGLRCKTIPLVPVHQTTSASYIHTDTRKRRPK